MEGSVVGWKLSGFGGCRCGCDGGLLEWCAVCVVSVGGPERGVWWVFSKFWDVAEPENACFGFAALG